MKPCAVIIVEIIVVIDGHQLHLGAIRKIDRFIKNQSATTNLRLQAELHEVSLPRGDKTRLGARFYAKKAALDRGGCVDLVTTSNFLIDATAPVLAGRVEGRGPLAKYWGDPALVFLLPAERFHGDALFSQPDFWGQVEQYLDVVTHAGASVTVDGSAVPAASLVPVGDGSFVATARRDR